MPNRFATTVLLALMPLIGIGCVYSEIPLGLADGSDAVFDQTLLGVWRSEGDKVSGKSEIRFERNGPESSEYIVGGAPGETSRLRHLRFDGISFFDVSMIDKKTQDVTHFIFRVRREGSRMTLDHLNADYFKKNPKSLASETNLWGSIHLTATTEVVRDFIRQNARNESVWVLGNNIYQKVIVLPSLQFTVETNPTSPNTLKPK